MVAPFWPRKTHLPGQACIQLVKHSKPEVSIPLRVTVLPAQQQILILIPENLGLFFIPLLYLEQGSESPK